MKKYNFNKRPLLVLAFLISLAASVKGQTPPTYDVYIANDTLTAANVYEFDIMIRANGSTTLFNLKHFQGGLYVNPTFVGAGTVTGSSVPASSQLPAPGYNGVYNWNATNKFLNMAANSGAFCGAPWVTTTPVRIVRVRMTNTVAFTCAAPNIKFNYIQNTTPLRFRTDVVLWDGSCAALSFYTPGNFGTPTFNSEVWTAGDADGMSPVSPYDNNKPSISVQPASVSACAGTSTSVSVTAVAPGLPSGTLTYQWQSNCGSGFADIPSATNNTLPLNSVSIGSNGCQYRVIVGFTCGDTLMSGTAVLTVNPNPVVTITGISATICQNAATILLTSQGSPSGGSYTVDGNPATSIIPSSLSVGPHSVCYNYTDLNGCTGQACTNFNITLCCTLTANCSATNASCFGGNGTASSTPVSGTGPYTYSWSNSATTQNISAPAGTYTVTILDLSSGCTATCSSTIGQPSQVTANCSVTPVSCFGGSNGTASVTAGGGTPGYTYLWSTTAVTSSISGLTIGTYTVTVTDANGCSTTCSSTVSQPSQVTASCSATPTSCFGGSNGTASVTAGGGSPGYTYLWSTTAATSSIGGLTAGTYTVTVTDSHGCSATCSSTVSQPSQVTANCSATPVSCFGGSNGTASVTAGGGTPGYTYLWSTTAATSSIGGLTAGTYTVTVTDANGCSTTCTSIVSQPSAVTAGCSATPLSCFGGSNGTASVTAGGGTPGYTYLWSTTAVTSSIGGLTAGTYTVTVTDANGCTATCSSTIGQPSQVTANCSATPVSCFGGSNGTASVTAGGGTPGYTYLWSTTAITSSISGLTIGTYTVTVTDSHGCSTTCSSTVSQPTVVTAGCSATPVSCFGGSNGTASVTAGGGSPGYTYLWSTTAATSSIGGLTAGTYTVTVTDSHGCSTTCSSTVSQPTQVTANCGATPVNCFGGSNGTASVTAGGGTPGYTYLWSTTAITSSIGGLTAGTYTVTVTDANGCSTTCSSTVSQPSAVTANCSATPVSCFGGSNGTASVTAGGGTPGYTYLWSTTAITSSISGLTAGSYTVTVTDSHGCSTTCSSTVSQPSAVTAGCSATPVSCFGGSNGTASVTAGGGTPGYTYLWSTTAVTSSIGGLTAGSYTVTVTDSHGCSTTCSSTVTQPTVVTAGCSATPVSCFGGSNGTASVTAGGGTPGYTYLWNTSAATSSINGLAAGTYTVTVTDSHGCSATCSSTVSQPTAVTAGCSSTPVNCFGGSNGTAGITAGGGTPGYTYLWSTTAVTSSISSLTAATYTVTVTDANGCSATCSSVVTQPTALTVAPVGSNAGCTGTGGTVSSNASGGTPLYTYLWSTGATTVNLSNRPTGVYTVTVTDSHGCSTSGSATVTPNVPIVVSGTVTNIVCKGLNTGAIATSVSGGNPAYTYLWNNGTTTQNRSALAAGTYTVTVTDVSGCTKTGSFTVTQPATVMSLNTSQTNVRCFGAQTGIATVSPVGGTSPYTYSWNTFPVKTTASINLLGAGSYTCTVVDAIGCSKNVTVNITEPTAIVAVQTQSNVTFPGGNNGSASVSVSGGVGPYTYLWNTTPAQTTATITGLVAGVYKCTINDSKPCVLKVSFTITEPFSKQASPGDSWKVKVSPNPSGGLVTLSYEVNTEERLAVSLTDITGKSVYEKEIVSVPGTNDVLFDFTQLPKGVYIMKIMNEDRNKLVKIVLQ